MNSNVLVTMKYKVIKDFKLPNSVDKIKSTDYIMSSYKDTVFIYGQPSGLFILAQSEVIFEDGTFKVVSNKHLLSILHSFIYGKCVACCFIRGMSKNFRIMLQLSNW